MDFLSLIKTVAPWIGTTIGGPLGGLAIGAACSALGLSENTESALKQAVSGATPEQLKLLKDADNDFALEMQKLGYNQIKDLEVISADDRKDARSLLVQIRSWVPAALSVVITLGFFLLLLGMMTDNLNIKDSQALLILLGSLATAFAQVMNFWFGTTSNSSRKDDIIAQAQPIK